MSHVKNTLCTDVIKRIIAWLRDRHREGIVCFHNTLLNSFHSLRAPQSKGDSEKPSCGVDEQLPLRGPRSRAHSVSFHVHHEFVQQGVLQISTLQPSSACEWRQSKDQRSITKQAETITNCQHRYTLGNMFWRMEKLWIESSQDLTQPSQQFMSLRKFALSPRQRGAKQICHPGNRRASRSGSPHELSVKEKEGTTTSYTSEDLPISSKREISRRCMTPNIVFPLCFFREILVNALRKTQPTYIHICIHTATLLGDVVLCRLQLLFHRTRQLSWSQRGFTVKDALIWRQDKHRTRSTGRRAPNQLWKVVSSLVNF